MSEVLKPGAIADVEARVIRAAEKWVVSRDDYEPPGDELRREVYLLWTLRKLAAESEGGA